MSALFRLSFKHKILKNSEHEKPGDISGTGSFVALNRICCYPVLERQYALGAKMVS